MDAYLQNAKAKLRTRQAVFANKENKQCVTKFKHILVYATLPHLLNSEDINEPNDQAPKHP
jgi:hypothetical protein